MMVAYSKPGATECLQKVMALPSTDGDNQNDDDNDDEEKQRTVGQVQTIQLFGHKQTSPLLKACQFQAVHAVGLLLAAGADPTIAVRH
jgi:hypothetical protein